MILKEDFFHQLGNWEQEWKRVLGQIPYPQGVLLWKGKLEAIHRLKTYFSTHEPWIALEGYEYTPFIELFNQLEQTFEESKRSSLKNHQKDEVVFYQGMLEGVRQVRLHFEKLNCLTQKKKRWRGWFK